MRTTHALDTDQQAALTYQRVVVERHGGPEVLRVIWDTVPEPGPAEVRVKILAAGVSFSDVEIRAGTYPGAPPPPLTPGYELVGVVDKQGPGAGSASLRPGQLVAAMTVVGSYAEYICLPEAELVPVPAEIDPAIAVCLVFNYLVAYQLLHRAAHVRTGERVLVQGAAGGVGTAALQLGKLAGLDLFGTASAADLELVAKLGATPVDYRRDDVAARIRTLTGGEGMDVVLDGIGGMTSLGSYRALRRNGRLVMFGHFATLVRGRRRLRSVALFYLTSGLPILAGLVTGLFPGGKRVRLYQCAKLKRRHPEWFRRDVTALFDLLQQGKIAPIVAARLPLEEARRAHELLGRGGVRGKIVLLCDAPAQR